MPGTITFNWSPRPEVFARRFFAVAESLDNRTLPLAAAGEMMQEDIRERFETETGPDGRMWQEWSDSYWPVAEAYPNEGVLTQSGALKEAASSSDATVITKDAVFYKTELLPHYGLAHDQGLENLPQREFLGMSDEGAMKIMGVFGEWFDRSIDLYVTSAGNVGMRHSIQGEGGFVSRASIGKFPL